MPQHDHAELSRKEVGRPFQFAGSLKSGPLTLPSENFSNMSVCRKVANLALHRSSTF
jgi:hypothetical protein